MNKLTTNPFIPRETIYNYTNNSPCLFNFSAKPNPASISPSRPLGTTDDSAFMRTDPRQRPRCYLLVSPLRAGLCQLDSVPGVHPRDDLTTGEPNAC
jgi:hypothetical protein